MRAAVLGVVGVVVALALPAHGAAAGIDDWCTVAEQVGDVQPGPACAAYLARVAEVAGAAAPCWEQIREDLPAEQWLAARRWCEDQAHLAVCGRVPCY